ncbi:MAG TPA: DHA2 family efflux MFS transporter permease subunit [Chloroflexota bacterium]|nr:DHA2 family efflux MFS transporter permease subunit [Chloroflexota bacterium]
MNRSEPQTDTNPWVVLLVLCMGFFMILLDTTIVNIAIPSIIDALRASLDQILWVLNAYILVYAVLLITAGRLGDIYGQRTLFAAGLALFTLASAFCGLAQDINQLILARVIQGIGGALLTPQTLAMLTTIFPPQRRGAAFGIWGAVAGVAAVAGPTLGGFIVTTWGWRWIFYVNLPIGIAALAATFLVIPDIRAGRRHRLDLLGVLLASAGLFGIVFGLIEGQRYNWGAIWGPLTIGELITAGVLVLVGFVVWERFQAEPLIPLPLFAIGNFALMSWVTAVMSFGMLGLFFPITIYLQSALGLSALQAGLTVAPQALVAMVVAPWSGRLADRIGGKYILMAGLVLFAAGMSLVDWRAAPDATWLTFLPAFLLSGFGMGCIFAPLNTVAMRNVEPRLAGAAAGVLNTTRQLGGVVGSAVVGAVLQNRLATALHDAAVTRSDRLPPQIPTGVRHRLVGVLAATGKGGLEVGRTQQGGMHVPSSVPAPLVHQIQQFFHDVFVQGYLDAMRPTLAVPVIMLLVGALSCLAIQRHRQVAERGHEHGDLPAQADVVAERRR